MLGVGGAALLGDFGARVIRVDIGAPGGDPARGPEKREPWDYEAELAQRNKLGLTLEVGKEAAREILMDLVGKTDVLVTDWLPPDLEKLGGHSPS